MFPGGPADKQRGGRHAPGRSVSVRVRPPTVLGGNGGFSLVETMIALFILTFGLLTTAQLLSAAASAGALARSKATAALATQDQIEHLSALFRRNPEDPEIIPGTHGPRTVEIADASNATVLNRFDLTWEVTELPPVRPGTTLGARQVTVTATPVAAAGAPNLRPRQNKAVAIAGIFSTRFP